MPSMNYHNNNLMYFCWCTCNMLSIPVALFSFVFFVLYLILHVFLCLYGFFSMVFILVFIKQLAHIHRAELNIFQSIESNKAKIWCRNVVKHPTKTNAAYSHSMPDILSNWNETKTTETNVLTLIEYTLIPNGIAYLN